MLNTDPQFDQYFPFVMSKIGKLTEEIDYSQLTKRAKRLQVERKYFLQFYPEITRTIPKWTWLDTQYGGAVCYHILRVLYCTLNDTDFKQLDKEKQNIIKWTVMLHDIAKRGTPTFFKKQKDLAHPYISAIVALDVFTTLSELEDILIKEKIRILKKEIKESIIYDKPDLSKLRVILDIAKNALSNSYFCFTVFKLIIMHQALPGLKRFKQPIKLTEEEIKESCDVEFIRLMEILMINDSINYHLQDKNYMKELYDCTKELCAGHIKLVATDKHVN